MRENQDKEEQLTVCAFNCTRSYWIDKIFPDQFRIDLGMGHAGEQLAIKILQHDLAQKTLLLHFDMTDQNKILLRKDIFNRILENDGFKIWNKRILTIRKSQIQKYNKNIGLNHTFVDKSFCGDSLVILKSDLNAKGWPEQSHAERSGYKTQQDTLLRELRKSDYRVLKLADLDEDLALRKDIFIERFITNRDGLIFMIFFCGERVAIFEAISSRLVRRMDNNSQCINYHLTTRESANHIELREAIGGFRFDAFRSAVRFANEFGLDYGNVQQVFDDDKRSYIVDVNPTPSSGRHEVREDIAQHLREGLFT